MHILHMCNLVDGGPKTDVGYRRAITAFHEAL